MTVVVYKINWTGAGYIDSLIGGFLLIIQGILTIASEITSIVGDLSLLSFSGMSWLNGLIMIVLGFVVLLFVWYWLQLRLRMGTPIKNRVLLGIILIVFGLISGGIAGILVLIGGILFIIGGIKETKSSKKN
jgi:hypothetical protein